MRRHVAWRVGVCLSLVAGCGDPGAGPAGQSEQALLAEDGGFDEDASTPYTYTYEFNGTSTTSSAGYHYFNMPSFGFGQREARLRLDYAMTCNATDMTRFPGLVATVTYGGAQRRVDLVRYQELPNQGSVASGWPYFREVQLGAAETGKLVEIRFAPQPSWSACQLTRLRVTVSPGWTQQLCATDVPCSGPDAATVAYRHAPYIAVRTDECSGTPLVQSDGTTTYPLLTDIPLELRYWMTPLPADQAWKCSTGPCQILHYAVIYSDEDYDDIGKTTIGHRFATYGHGGDNDLIYTVLVDHNGNALERTYSTYETVISGIPTGHKDAPFDGYFLPNTDHPILSVRGQNNTCDTTLRYCAYHDPAQGIASGLVGHQLVPIRTSYGAQLTNVTLLEDPWIEYVTDLEHRRENKGSKRADERLWIVYGDGFDLNDTSISGWYPSLGLNVSQPAYYYWSKWSFDQTPTGSALVFDGGRLDSLQHGTISGWVGLTNGSRVAVRPADPLDSKPHFYRLVRGNGTFRTVSLDSEFCCNLDTGSCTFPPPCVTPDGGGGGPLDGGLQVY